MSSSSDLPRSRYLKARRGACAGTIWQSPVGPLELLASERGLRLAEFVPPPSSPALLPQGEKGATRLLSPLTAATEAAQIEERPGVRGNVQEILAQAVDELAGYFAGRRCVFTVPLDLDGTPFQLGVWNALLAIPYGTTLTYRQLAAAAGRAAAVRAAGAANGANPLAIVVPCHRVVGSDGSLTGYAGGLWRKRFLLDLERSADAAGTGARPPS